MSFDEGLGNCLILKEDGVPCNTPIGEGEPIGTVMDGGPKVGHKNCADAFRARRDMVKRIDQAGPGGAVDYSSERDALEYSIPLEKRPGVPLVKDSLEPAEVQTHQEGLGHLAPITPEASQVQTAPVPFIGAVPLDATAEEAVRLAMPDEAQNCEVKITVEVEVAGYRWSDYKVATDSRLRGYPQRADVDSALVRAIGAVISKLDDLRYDITPWS